MDNNRIEGALDQAKGAVKETIGKVVGNDKLQADGGRLEQGPLRVGHAGPVHGGAFSPRALQDAARPSAEPAGEDAVVTRTTRIFEDGGAI